MALAVAFAVLPALGQLHWPFPLTDEALLLVYPEQMLAGRVPNLDFFTVYGPGGFGLLAAVYAVAGPAVVVERAVGLVYHAAIAAGVVRLTSPFGRTAAYASGITSAVLLVLPGPAAYAWFGGLALVVWSLATLVRPASTRTTFIGGLLGGLVAAWRIEMLVLLIAAGPLIWRQRSARSYLSGVAVGLAPTAVFLVVAGRQVVGNVFVSRMAVDARMALDTVSGPVWLGIGLSVLIVLALTLAALRSSWRRRELLAYAVLGALLLPQELQRVDVFHVVYVMCVIAPLGVALLLSRRAADPMSGPSRRFMLVTLVALAMLTAAGTFVSLSGPAVTALSFQGRSVPVDSRLEPGLSAELRLIQRTFPRGARVFVGAEDMSVPTFNDVGLYHLLGGYYRSDFYYLELPPGVAEKAGSPLVSDVRHADGLVLVHVPRRVREEAFPNIRPGSEAANELVSSRFCPTGSTPLVTVYVRCDAQTS